LKRFRNEIEGSLPHAFDRKFDRGEGRYEYHGQSRVKLADRGEQVEPFPVCHLLVGEHGIEVSGTELCLCLRDTTRL
jgi:hypothetical protein